jgi:hypothetical protein
MNKSDWTIRDKVQYNQIKIWMKVDMLVFLRLQSKFLKKINNRQVEYITITKNTNYEKINLINTSFSNN